MVKLVCLFVADQDRATLLLGVASPLMLYHAVPYLFPNFTVFGMDFGYAIETSNTAGGQEPFAASADIAVAEKDGDLGSILYGFISRSSATVLIR